MESVTLLEQNLRSTGVKPVAASESDGQGTGEDLAHFAVRAVLVADSRCAPSPRAEHYFVEHFLEILLYLKLGCGARRESGNPALPSAARREGGVLCVFFRRV